MTRRDLDAGKPASNRKLAKRPRRYIENAELAAASRRFVAALGKRVSGSGDLAALRELSGLRDQIEQDLLACITELRSFERAYSWEQIAGAIGITRQSAMQRFRKAGGARLPGGQPSRWR